MQKFGVEVGGGRAIQVSLAPERGKVLILVADRVIGTIRKEKGKRRWLAEVPGSHGGGIPGLPAAPHVGYDRQQLATDMVLEFARTKQQLASMPKHEPQESERQRARREDRERLEALPEDIRRQEKQERRIDRRSRKGAKILLPNGKVTTKVTRARRGTVVDHVESDPLEGEGKVGATVRTPVSRARVLEALAAVGIKPKAGGIRLRYTGKGFGAETTVYGPAPAVKDAVERLRAAGLAEGAVQVKAVK